MTRVQIVYWRDIPAQVKARDGRQRAARPLSDRFQQAIDEAAMRAGLSGTDAYLAEWRTSDREERSESPADAAEATARELEAAYPASRLASLVAEGGIDRITNH
ncbi:MAG TPA: virulence factor [Anaerolineales bacterium]|nr:virulence factor [Anaerolineales bacterium]